MAPSRWTKSMWCLASYGTTLTGTVIRLGFPYSFMRGHLKYSRTGRQIQNKPSARLGQCDAIAITERLSNGLSIRRIAFLLTHVYTSPRGGESEIVSV